MPWAAEENAAGKGWPVLLRSRRLDRPPDELHDGGQCTGSPSVDEPRAKGGGRRRPCRARPWLAAPRGAPRRGYGDDRSRPCGPPPPRVISGWVLVS
jgi:hypothetical protein